MEPLGGLAIWLGWLTWHMLSALGIASSDLSRASHRKPLFDVSFNFHLFGRVMLSQSGVILSSEKIGVGEMH